MLLGSPALDAGSNALASAAGLTSDQRGAPFSRVLDSADADATQTVDVGALEQHPSISAIPAQLMQRNSQRQAPGIEVRGVHGSRPPRIFSSTARSRAPSGWSSISRNSSCLREPRNTLATRSSSRRPDTSS